MKNKLKQGFGLISLLVLVVLYQNCSQELGVFNQKSLQSNSTAPFPISIDVDTIGHTTCANQSAGSAGWFNFRLKAKNSQLSGVQIRSEFLQYLEDNNKSGDPKKIEQVLSEATQFSAADLYMGIVDGINPVGKTSVYFDSGVQTGYVEKYLKTLNTADDYSAIANLKEGEIASNIVFSPSVRQFDLSASKFGAANEENLRNQLDSGKYNLAFFFPKDRQSHTPRGPLDFSDTAGSNGFFGTAYRLNFRDEVASIPSGGNYISVSIPNVGLSSVTVLRGENLEIKDYWNNCSTYRVVPQSDIDKPETGCSSSNWRNLEYVNSGSGLTVDQAAQVNHFVDMLGENSQWQVNPECKSLSHISAASCYHSNANIDSDSDTDISYNVNDWHTCNNDNYPKGIYCCRSDGSVQLCPRYISTCTKF